MQRLNQDIKSGNFKQVYLLYGDERYLCRQFRDRLKSALCEEGDSMNVHFYQGKEIPIDQVIDLARTVPFFAPRRVFFIEDSGLFKSGGERLAEYLAVLDETAYFVFWESEVDKRSKLYKTVQSKGYAAELSRQDEDTLLRWVAGMLKREGKKITAQTAALFLSKTGTDMNQISTELEKLVCYCMDKEVIEDRDVEAICTNLVGNHIFDMVDAIGAGRRKQALSLYFDLVALREPPMRILFLLARQFNILMQVKTLRAAGFDNKSIAAKVGVPSFTIGKYASQAARFHMPQLKAAVEKCVEAEEAVKTGRMGDTLSLEVLILSFL